jgi:hypothetical protein
MKIACCVCFEILGENDYEPKNAVTHTYCDKHYREAIEEAMAVVRAKLAVLHALQETTLQQGDLT